MPWMVGVVGLTLIPLVGSLVLSLVYWDGLDWDQGIRWAGGDHYRRIWGGDPLFVKMLTNSVVYALMAAPLNVAASLLAALLLWRPMRGLHLFRALYYLPHLLAGVATVMIWGWLFNPRFGPINEILSGLAGLLGQDAWTPPGWFYSPTWCKPALALMNMWHFGSAMLVFLAALTQIPDSVGEAARLDGAGRWARFRHIIWPHLSLATTFNLVTGLVFAMQAFHQPFLLANRSQQDGLLFYVVYLYRLAFEPPYELGYASAVAWVFSGVLLLLVLAAFGLGRRWPGWRE